MGWASVRRSARKRSRAAEDAVLFWRVLSEEFDRLLSLDQAAMPFCHALPVRSASGSQSSSAKYFSYFVGLGLPVRELTLEILLPDLNQKVPFLNPPAFFVYPVAP